MTKNALPTLLIYNARLITEDKLINKAWVLIKAGRIHTYGHAKKPLLKGIESIDAQDDYVGPGFIDLHIHGDVKKISYTQVRYGTVGFLLGLHTDHPARLCAYLSRINEIRTDGAKCFGVNLEGPFLNKEMAGAQPKKYICLPNKRILNHLLCCGGGLIKIMTLACEQKGSMALIKELEKRKIIAALGHTKATYEQAEKAINSGACYGTHVFNRMGEVLARSPGIIAAVLLDERMTAEVIADGMHVHPALLKLLVKNKPSENIVLVTDSVAAMDEGTQKLIGKVYRLEDFTIAGSNLTMIEAVKNMIKFSGIDLIRAVKMASLNPSFLLKLSHRKGSIAQGKDADIVVFTARFHVKMTLINGKIIYRR